VNVSVTFNTHGASVIRGVLTPLTAIVNMVEVLRRTLAAGATDAVPGEDVFPDGLSKRRALTHESRLLRLATLGLGEPQVHDWRPT
jgi:hypothetical protein